MAEATDMTAEIAADQLRATFAEIAFLIFTVGFAGWAAYAASRPPTLPIYLGRSVLS